MAIAASFIANKTNKVSFITLLAIILIYQGVGTLAEWAMTSSFYLAIQDFRIGIPGMLVQLFGCYIILSQTDKIKS